MPPNSNLSNKSHHQSHSSAGAVSSQRFRSLISGSVWDKYTAQWKTTLLRFLTLAQREDRFRALELERTAAGGWKHSTNSTYWGAILCVRKILSLPVSAADSMTSRTLEHLAKSEVHDYPRPMHKILVLQLWLIPHPSRHGELIAALIVTSFLFGQRVSDIAQLAVVDLEIQYFPLQRTSTVCVTVRRGKVIPHIGPYSLHCSGPLAERLWRWRMIRMQEHREFLFSDGNTPDQRQRLGTHVRNELKAWDPELEQRSIRRGGLQLMASSGMPLETIRSNFSKHTTAPMLMTYLQHGAVLWDQATVQITSLQWFGQMLQVVSA